MMGKGFSDGLAGVQSYKLVSGDDAAQADLLIKGHIEQYKLVGHFSKKAMIKVRGDVRLASTGKVVALIFVQRQVASRGQSVDKEFYDIGRVMAAKLSE
jgi:superfamily II helicase